jgi:DNA helicase-2/ATP-dependent DNA helicase PcrA
MLLEELVPETLGFLYDNPASPHRPSFDHVIVDEYQDLNRAEQVLLDEFVGDGALTVIGYEDQSIYSFKHAHLDGISKFDQTHHGTHDESLDYCRRCPRIIVGMANSLISNNISRSNRRLEPFESNPEGEVYIVQWPSMDNEADGLATFVAQRIREGKVEPGQVLILAPRRQFGYKIRDALSIRGVDAHSFFHEEALHGDSKKAESCAAQESLALLTLLAHPNDNVALRCWCGFGSPSLRRGAWAKLRQHAETTELSPRTVLEQLTDGKLDLPHTKGIIDRFQLLQERLVALDGVLGAELIDSLFTTNESWAEPLRSLAQSLSEEGQPVELLDLIQRGVTQPELPMDVDYVRVMSLYKSKGLTADLVIVVGCIDGVIPFITQNVTAEERECELEEQRRLFYVAITRT